MKRTPKFAAVAAALAGAGLLAGCASARAAHVRPHPQHTVSAAQLAIHRAVSAECAQAQPISASVNSAQTIGQFATRVSGWEAQLTAVGHVPMAGVPHTLNAARQIQVYYAEANLALAVAAQSDDPFAAGFSTGRVKRGYSAAVSALQNVLNRCAEEGQ